MKISYLPGGKFGPPEAVVLGFSPCGGGGGGGGLLILGRCQRDQRLAARLFALEALCCRQNGHESRASGVLTGKRSLEVSQREGGHEESLRVVKKRKKRSCGE